MKTYREITVTETREILDSTTCDLCGKEIVRPDIGPYETSTVETADHDGYDGAGVQTEYDVCAECFKTKLMPWMESQGARRERLCFEV